MAASESNIQALVRLEAANRGWQLFRNNRGAATLSNGSYVRFGLANDSKQIGDMLKSGDLIGWRPVVITPDMVGRTIAVFTSIECKASDWRPTSSEREAAQRRWADLVNRYGGYAIFCNDPTKL